MSPVQNNQVALFRVKICGITTAADARVAVSAGADAIGLNFFRRSPRYVDSEQARKIVNEVPANVVRVGVFVNESLASIAEVVARTGINWLQLHGDETPAFVVELSNRLPALPITRAFRCRDSGLQPIRDYLRGCPDGAIHSVLVDAYAEGVYGGSGEKVDWGMVARRGNDFGNKPVILAGGLTPHNVASAICTASPDGVDVASGVETSPGRKSAEQVAAFVQSARTAFGSCG